MNKLIYYGLLASTCISPAAIAQTQTWGISGTTGLTIFTPLAGNTMPSVNQIDNSLSIGVTGGTLGSVHSVDHNLITLYGAPNVNFWSVLDGLTFSGNGGSGQHVAHYDQTVRYGTGPELWAAVAEMTDFTNKPSSQTGADLSYEMDLTGHQLDDAGSRQLLSGVIRPASDGNTFFESTGGYNLNVGAGAYARHFYTAGGAYTSSAIDLRYAAPFNLGATSLAGITFPVTTAAVSNSVTISVSNVMPFTSDTWGRELNSNHSSNTVYINGVAYSEVGYAVTGTGPTPAGTLTLSAAVTLPTSGLQVANSSAAIWLATGQPINLDTNGATSLTSNGNTITVKGTLSAAMTGGASCAAGSVTLSTLVVVNGIITAC